LSSHQRNLEPAPVLGFSEIFESSRPDESRSEMVCFFYLLNDSASRWGGRVASSNLVVPTNWSKRSKCVQKWPFIPFFDV